jgi:hypothetical protein
MPQYQAPTAFKILQATGRVSLVVNRADTVLVENINVMIVSKHVL